MTARSVAAGRGIAWWTEAWALFMSNAGMWIVLGLILIASLVTLDLVPVVGGLISALVTPVLAGGWMIAARKTDSGGTLEAGDLFAGFRQSLNPLLVLGVLMLAATLAIWVIATIFGLGAIFGVVAGGLNGSMENMMAAIGAAMVGLLVVLVLGLLLTMAIWFAPALVALQNRAPTNALKASFAASLKNVGAFLLYGLLYILAAIFASIPLGLGWLVLIPLLMLTVYTSYRDIFGN